MNLTPRRLLAAVAAGALLVAPIATAAQAAGPQYPAGLTHTKLVLDPADRGYAGTMTFTVTWRGTEPTGNLSVVLTEPVAGSFRAVDPPSACWFSSYGESNANRRDIGCGLSYFAPGQQQTFTLSFAALTPAQVQPMIADGGHLSIVDGSTGSIVSPVRDFSATFRGTNGKVKNPLPYVQDTSTDITLTAGAGVTLTRQDDGSYLGRLPMTVRWNGTAPNYEAYIGVSLPEGWYTPDTDPSSQAPCWQGCSVPGGALMDGDVRSFDLLIHAPEDAVVGTTGTTTARVAAGWGFSELPEVTPADNTVTFTYTVA